MATCKAHTNLLEILTCLVQLCLDGVGIFVAEKWVDNAVSVEKHSERVLILKTVLDNGLLNVLTVYAPHRGKPQEEKENFWNELFSLVSCILQSEMVILAGDMNGILEVIMLAMMERMVVIHMKLEMQMAPGVWSMHMG